MIKGITTERTKGNTLESLSISRRKLSFPNNNKFIRIASISEVKDLGWIRIELKILFIQNKQDNKSKTFEVIVFPKIDAMMNNFSIRLAMFFFTAAKFTQQLPASGLVTFFIYRKIFKPNWLSAAVKEPIILPTSESVFHKPIFTLRRSRASKHLLQRTTS